MPNSEQALTAQLLGRPKLIWQGKPVELSARKPLAMLYILAISRQGVPKDLLAELLWAPGKRSNVRSALYTLREEISAGAWLVSTEDEVRLQVNSDLAEFEHLMKYGNSQAARALWRNAQVTGSSRTALLEGFSLPSAPAFQDWLEVERARVSMLYLDCLSLCAAELEEEQCFGEALALLRELTGEDPLNEDVHRRIMHLEWRQGCVKAALEQFEACRRILAEELGLEPVSSTVALFESIREQASSLTTPKVVDAYAENALIFVGRNAELGELNALLPEHRLITLLGPGGIGKTRLAHEVLRQTQFAKSREAFFVPLSAIHDTRFVSAAIANAMRLTFKGPEEPLLQLCSALREQPTLLILDNVEHLTAVGDIIETLLGAVPKLNIVATSRRALELSGELRFRVSGLPFPQKDRDLTRASYDAVRLFVTAAHHIDPSFSLSDETKPAVYQICRLLQGHPLALELAAGWLRFHDCNSLAQTLDQDMLQLENPGLPLSERHSSLRLVMERSWAALSDGEKLVLASLSVCRGGFDQQAARAIAGADMATLISLTDQSLLRLIPEGRYDLHPLVHEFGREKMLALPEHKAIRMRHAHFFLKRLSAQHEFILGKTPGPALDTIERDFENIREAWLHAGHLGWGEELLAAADALSLFADMRVRFHEAVQLFGDVVDVLDANPHVREETKAVLLGEKGTHLYRLSRYEEALALTEGALENLPPSEKSALRKLLKLKAIILNHMGNYPEAKEMLEAVLEFSRETAPDSLSRDIRALANAETCIGLYTAAERHYREAIALDRKNDYLIGTAINLNNLAELLILMARFEEAEVMIEESLGYAEGVDIHLVPYLSLNKAELAYRRGDTVRASEYALACKARAEKYGQMNLRSLSSTLLARLALAQADPDAAKQQLTEAIEVAYEAQQMGSLMHAFVVLGELFLAQGNDAHAVRYLHCARYHSTSEFSVKTKAEHLLYNLVEPEECVPSVETLVHTALSSLGKN